MALHKHNQMALIIYLLMPEFKIYSFIRIGDSNHEINYLSMFNMIEKRRQKTLN